MVNYQEAAVKLTNTQLNKLNTEAKNKTKTISRLNEYEDEELPHELFLTTRQTTKIRNIFANNMSTAIKRSTAQISKISKSSWYFGAWLANLGRKALTHVAFFLAGDKLAGLVSNLTSSAINN